MILIRQKWREHYGPGSWRMPVDAPLPLINMSNLPVHYEDSQDGIDVNGHALGNIGAEGGSGIVFGHSMQDPENVILLEEAMHKRPELYDGPCWEHWIRKIRRAIARTEMIRDTIGPRRVLAYANIALLQWDRPYSADPGWRPMSINQYYEEARLNPHIGLNMNLRATGEVAFGEAMACKIDRNRDRRWLRTFRDTCRLAAIPKTGQIGNGPNTGGLPTIPLNVQYSFHWGILAHADLCVARVLGEDPAEWVIDGMNSLENQAEYSYYGAQTMNAFLYSDNGVLVPATGPGQHGDPAFAWWSMNCACLAQMDPGVETFWKQRALKWGPIANTDEQSRKFTQHLRGIS